MGRDLSKFELRYGKPIKQGYIRFGIKLCMSAKRYCYVFYTLHETPDKDDLLRWELDFHPEHRGHKPLTWGYPFGKKGRSGEIRLRKGSVTRREGRWTDHYLLEDRDGSKWYIPLPSLQEDFDRKTLTRDECDPGLVKNLDDLLNRYAK